ncbi:hypothetical protein A2U01_0103839, partial [Trifolium medium]|nr:hypothetical protein [Trifolium medium]
VTSSEGAKRLELKRSC